MRVFLTGATGFIGSRVVPELIRSGHQVLGLGRSDAGAESLAAAGAQVQRGDLEDLESLRSGAAASDAVIHTAFRHDWSRFAESCELDKRAIKAIGAVLQGSSRPFIVSSGVGVAQGRTSTEDDPPLSSPSLPRVSEVTAVALMERGVHASVMRLPQVHDTVKQGLVTPLIAVARAKGVSAYVGEGHNRWPAAHVRDVAFLYRLALEKKGSAGARYLAVAEEGVTLKDIATAIGRGLNVPVISISQEQAQEHFGFLGFFAGRDAPASSAKTRAELGWNPTGVSLLTDLANMNYTQA